MTTTATAAPGPNEPFQHLEHLRAAVGAETREEARAYVKTTSKDTVTDEDLDQHTGNGVAAKALTAFINKLDPSTARKLLADHYVDDKKVHAAQTVKGDGTKAVSGFFKANLGIQFSFFDPSETDNLTDGSWRVGLYQTLAVKAEDKDCWQPLRKIRMLDLCEDVLDRAKQDQADSKVKAEHAETYRDLILGAAVSNDNFEKTGREIETLLLKQRGPESDE